MSAGLKRCQPAANGKFHQRRQPVEVELGHEAAAIGIDALGRQPELGRDLQAGVAFDHQLEHFHFARAQALERVLALGRCDRADGDAVAEIALTGVDHAHRRDHLMPRRFLQQVAIGTRPQRLMHDFRLGMHGERKQARARRDRAQAARDVDAARHGDVQDGDVGLLARGETYRYMSVGERRDHAHVRLLLEEPGHAFAHQRMVVNQDYPDHWEKR